MMNQRIAIKDFPGIILFLESLGGINIDNLRGGGDWIPFSIDKDGRIWCPVFCKKMSLSEFMKEYMYEIETKVKHKDKRFPCRIERISMRDGQVIYTLRTFFGKHLIATKNDFVLKSK